MMQDDTNAADILMGDVVRLEDVLSRDSVRSISKSFFALFGLPVRVISHEGDLLADVHRDRPLCNYLNTLANGQRECANTVGVVRDLEPDSETIVHPCFTGAVYRIAPLAYQGRPIGRVIIGPYVPAETHQPPASLTSIDDGIDVPTVREHFNRMPRVREDIAEQLCTHLSGVLELLVFSGHRAQLASTMQVASVRENYRELAEKNEALKTSYDELKQLDQLKSTFLATVSHELRTPLTSIIGYTEMLESGAAGALSDGQSEFLTTIRSKADQLLGLISSLLDLGHLEAKSLELHNEAVDPARPARRRRLDDRPQRQPARRLARYQGREWHTQDLGRPRPTPANSHQLGRQRVEVQSSGRRRRARCGAGRARCGGTCRSGRGVVRRKPTGGGSDRA